MKMTKYVAVMAFIVLCFVTVSFGQLTEMSTLQPFGSDPKVRDTAFIPELPGQPIVVVGRFDGLLNPQTGEVVNSRSFAVLSSQTGQLSQYHFNSGIPFGSIESVDCKYISQTYVPCVIAGGNRQFGNLTNRDYVFMFNLVTGQIFQDFIPPFIELGGNINHVRIYQPDQQDSDSPQLVILAGGRFSLIRQPDENEDGSPEQFVRLNMMALNLNGRLLKWDPSLDNVPFNIKVTPMNKVMLSGDFERVNNRADNTNVYRQGYAEVEGPTNLEVESIYTRYSVFDLGLATSFNPSPPSSVTGVTGLDTLFWTNPNTKEYEVILIGFYDKMAGKNHNGVAKVTQYGKDTGWSVSVNPLPYQVYKLAGAITGNYLYLLFAGTENIGGGTHTGFVVLDLFDGFRPTGINYNVNLPNLINFPQGGNLVTVAQQPTIRRRANVFLHTVQQGNQTSVLFNTRN